MARVLVADPIADSARVKIVEAGFEVVVRDKENDGPLTEQIKGFDCIIVRSATKVTREVFEAADNLKLVVRAGVGLDNVDLEAAKDHGVKVLNTPEAPTVSVAEMVFALMFALARRITQADNLMKREEWAKKKLKGVELWQKTLGIIGFGRIGYEVGKRAKVLGMKVLAYDVVDIDKLCKDIGAKRVEFDELLKRSDFVTIHVPLLPQTRALISSEQFKMMKDGAFLINTARGGVVDEKALLEALDAGLIAGAALDVFESEPPTDWAIARHPKIIATPHLSSSTVEAQVRVGELTAQKVIDELT